jgi:hypothetical protein
MPAAQFAKALRGLGVEAELATLDSDVDIVVVGDAPTVAELTSLLSIVRKRLHRRLQIFTQRSLVAAMREPDAAGCTPTWRQRYRNDATDWLANHWVSWPSTEVEGIGNGLEDVDWPKPGVLKKLGYETSVSETLRHRILTQAFEMASVLLPVVAAHSHMMQWGDARTPARLQKMADCLASWAKLEKRKAVPRPHHEIWEADLDWMKQSLYLPCQFTFEWPGFAPASTSAAGRRHRTGDEDLIHEHFALFRWASSVKASILAASASRELGIPVSEKQVDRAMMRLQREVEAWTQDRARAHDGRTDSYLRRNPRPIFPFKFEGRWIYRWTY